MEFQYSGSQAARIAATSANTLQFVTNNVEAMRINSAGNVGIGTTSPETFLQLGTYAVAGKYIDQAAYPVLPSEHMMHITAPSTNNYYGGGISFGEQTFTAANIVARDAGGSGALDLCFGTGNNTGVTEKLRIANNGNVGIGTDSPGAKLEVKKGSTGQAYSNVEGILIDTNGASNLFYGLRVGSSAGNANLAVTNAGRVGIGTDQPEVSLDLGSKNDAVSLPAGDNTARGNIANPEVGMIRYNTTDYQFEGYSGVGAAATWGALGGGGTPTVSKQLFQVTTATPTFVLTNPQVNPQDANYVNIFIDGVYQNSGTYTVATATGVTTVTLNTNAPVGTSVEIISTT